MSPSIAAYALYRASSSDATSLAELLFDSFDAFARENFFGIPTRDELPKLAAKYSDIIKSDSADAWIKVVEIATGRLVAASNWKLYAAPASAQPRAQDEPSPWMDAATQERQRLLIEPMNAAREAANDGSFIYLHILATHPDFRRKGLGSMMMQWGVDVADSFGLPGWIEASPEGNYLYKRFGFHDYCEIIRDDEQLGRRGEVLGTTMRRKARSTPLAILESDRS